MLRRWAIPAIDRGEKSQQKSKWEFKRRISYERGRQGGEGRRGADISDGRCARASASAETIVQTTEGKILEETPSFSL
jgi:hypothetical protein